MKRFEAARAFVGLLCAVAQHVDESSDLRHIRQGTRLAAGAPFPWGELPLEVPVPRRNSKAGAALAKIKAAIDADAMASVVVDVGHLLKLVEQEMSRAELVIETIAEVEPKPAPNILRRAASAVGLGQAAKPTPAQVTAKPDEPLPYTFNDYHDVIH